MRALGVDLGSKRIGIAVSDPSGTIASPLTVVHRSKSRRRDLDEIARIAHDEEVELIVVGLPLTMRGEVGHAAEAAIAEAARLATVGRRARRDARRAAHHGDRRTEHDRGRDARRGSGAAWSTRSPPR